MTGNPVRFIYISAGKERPTPIDPDAIYFMEGEKQIWVGSTLIADSVEPVDVSSYLLPYLVKDIAVVGEGQMVANAELDEATGKIIFTKGDPSIQKGVSPSPTVTELTPGAEFTVVSGTSVSDTTIYDQLIKFKLPVQIASINLRRQDSGNSNIIIDTVTSDGITSSNVIEFFGSAAFADASDFATAAQGEKADAAMLSENGTATGAHIELANDPVSELEAATKRYVDNTVESAISDIGTVFNYRGDSSTPITDGGREEPTIDGESIDPTQGMKKGDVVTYDGKEFLWNGSAWQSFGDEGSYALKTITVTGSDGLTGGGDLTSDIVIQHSVTGTGSSENYEASSADVGVITSISVDKFGHVQSASSKDISSDIANIAEAIVDNVLADYMNRSETESAIDSAKDELKSYVDEAIQDIPVSAPEYTISGEEDQSGTYDYIYHLMKDGQAVPGSDINIPKASIIKSSEVKTVEEPDVPYPGAVPGEKYIDFTTGDGPDDHIYIPTADIGGSIYSAGQGIDISSTDEISHQNIGDGSDIGFTDASVDENDENKLIFTRRLINRDSMGHVESASDDGDMNQFTILSEEGVRQMILDYIPTWMVAQSDSTNNYVIEPITPGAEQTGNDIYFSGTSESPLVVNYSPINTSNGRLWAAAWVGAKILAPEYVTEDNIANVKYDRDGNTGIGTDVASGKSFASGHDGIINGRYYMEVWVPLTKDNVLAAASTHSTIYRSYSFYMEDNPSEKVTFTVEVSPENVELTNTNGVQDVETVVVINWEESQT